MSAQPPYGPPTTPPPGYSSRGANRAWVFAAAFLALVIIGGIGYWLGGRNTSTPSASPPTAPAASVAASVAASASAVSSADASTVGSLAASAPASTAPASTPAAKTTTPAPTKTSASVSPTPTVTPFTHPDPDFGYVTAITTAGGVSKLSFDRATLLTGPAAATAAKAHGQVVEDDYYIVNDNKLIRTFELSPTLVVAGSSNLSGEVGPKPSTLAALTAWVTGHPTQRLPVDLSYDAAGKVTKVTEVFFP